MSIIIKELFPSDPLSEALEKINFNFDQLILAGGGPPGPIGPGGPQGVPGPLGPRGDHWFVGPSALGQTADHGGGSLKIEDHFLDSLGDVYSYFDVLGSTGWTDSGVNLKGPTGPTGITGGSDDVQIQAGGSGNVVTPIGGGYGPQASTVPTSLIDFWFPKNMSKNSIFVGDIDWSVNYLQNFGSNASVSTDQNSVPQLTVIQKNTNQSGLNGLMLGVYGATTGATSLATIEGSTGSTTSVFDFIHMGFAKPFNINVSGYDRLFRIKSFRQKFRIEVGGITASESLTSLDLASKNFSWINNTNGQFMSSLTRQSITTHDLISYSGGVVGSGININTKPNLSGAYNIHNYGIIGLQNEEGVAPNIITNMNPLHGFGNVHIGSTAGLAGVRIQNGIGIQRPIDFGSGNNDSSIRFYGGESLGDAGEWGYIGGGIRLFKQFINNTGGTAPIRAIQFGSGYTIGGTPTPATQSRQVGGRIGINNHPGWNDFNAARSINMPIHFNLGGYFGTDRAESPFPGQPVISEIEQWALGLDYGKITGGETGIYHAGIDTDSPGLGIAYSHGYTGATGTSQSRNIILQSYYVGEATFNSISNKRTPNLYSQVGNETTFGNLGLGFAPKSGVTLSKTEAWSKLSINGSVTVGDIAAGYHLLESLRPTNGLLIQGDILQGATGVTGLYSTLIYGPNAINPTTDNQIKISSPGILFGSKYIARQNSLGSEADKIPSYSSYDLRTGINFSSGLTGVGVFTVAGPELTNILSFDPNIAPTGLMYQAARWQAKSSEGSQGDQFAPALVASTRLVEAPTTIASGAGGRTYTLQDLVDNGFATNYDFFLPPPGGIGRRRQIWLQIPSTHSTAILDFSTGATFGIWGTGSNPSWIPATQAYYLNGDTVGIGSPRVGTEGQIGITIEPGQYDGQKLTVIIKNVDERNAVQFYGGVPFVAPLSSTNQQNWYVRFKAERAINSFPLNQTSPAPVEISTNINFSDVMVMARDYYSQINGTPINSPSFRNLDTEKMPYPVPNATESLGPFPAPTGTTATIYNNLYSPTTPSSRGWHNDVGAIPNGSGGTLLIIGGWRVINFTWMNDYIPEIVVNENIGCWVETGREYLATRGSRNNTGIL